MKHITSFAVIALLSLALISISNAEDNAKLDISGVLQSEFSYIASENENESDAYLSTMELSIDPSLGSNVFGHLLVLYEYGENDENFVLDEGYVSLKMPVSESIEFSTYLGRLAIPFGEFSSHFVTDSYVLEIGETKQHAFGLALNHEIIQVSSAIYKDRLYVNGRNNNWINAFAFKLKGSTPQDMFGKKANVSLGGSFISNIAGTGDLSEMFVGTPILKRVSGLNGFVSINVMGVFLNAETIISLDDIETSEGDTQKPKSINIELGYALPNMPIEIAGKYENLSFNEDSNVKRFGGILSVGIFGDTAKLNLEFLRTDDGDTKYNSITGQISIEF
ncbi:MAG: LbtU family siderophore porin [Candidatus Poribacteria bacterium]